MAKRKRTVGSVKSELIVKSREAALCAIRTFNDPQVTFKSETFIVLMVIAWTYLLHAYYRAKGVEYRYYQKPAKGGKRRKFERTKHGQFRHWELESCLKAKECPIDRDTRNNLSFLVGLRHEIEHQMTQSLDAWLSGRYQACALNYNHYLKKLFGESQGLDSVLAFSIQFADLSPEQTSGTRAAPIVAQPLRKYIDSFDDTLDHDAYNSPRYSYRMLFKRKLVNRPGQADRVVEFIDPSSDLARTIDKEYWVKKEVERKKYRAKDVVAAVNKAGFKKFNVFGTHTRIWQAEDAKNPAKGYGVDVQGVWYWYQNWVDRCIELCREAGDKYR